MTYLCKCEDDEGWGQFFDSLKGCKCSEGWVCTVCVSRLQNGEQPPLMYPSQAYPVEREKNEPEPSQGP